MQKIYHNLQIKASDSITQIWLGCDKGFFVDKNDGILEIGLMPGTYIVEFGLGSQCYKVELYTDLYLTEKEILLECESCERPIPII